MKPIISLLIFIALSIPASIARGSTGCEGAKPSHDGALRAIQIASANSPIGHGSSVAIEASAGDADAVLKLAKGCAWYEPPASPGGGGTSLMDTTSLKLKTPVATGGRATELASLSGVGGGTQLEFRWTRASTAGLRVGGDTNAVRAACDAFERDFEKKKAEYPEIKKWVCTGTNLRAVFAGDPRLADFFALFVDPKTHSTTSWSVALGTGVDDFTYFNPQSLVAAGARRSQRSASVAWGYHTPEADHLFIAEARIKDSYRAAKVGTRCPQASGNVALNCVSGSLGEPVLANLRVLSGEYRKLLSDNQAIALAVKRDFKRKITAVEIPIYFVGDSKGGLTGGLSLGWTSADKQANLAFFIGQPFSLF